VAARPSTAGKHTESRIAEEDGLIHLPDPPGIGGAHPLSAWTSLYRTRGLWRNCGTDCIKFRANQMFNLIYSVGGEPQRYTLEPGETVVGRLPVCDLVIDDPSVSRRHARLSVFAGRCKVQDLESRNGTFVNGEPVTETELADGNELVFGSFPTHLEYSAEDRLSLSEGNTVLESGTVYKALGEKTSHAQADGSRSEQRLDGPRLLAMMSEIARSLVTAQPLISVLNRVVDLAFESIPAERAFLMLSDETTGAIVPRVVRNRDGTPSERTSISSTIVRRVMTERVAVLARDAQMDTRLAEAQSVYDASIRSFMCAPLWNENRVIGVLYIDNPFTKEFSTSDLDLFTSLSDYAAVAIEQARLTTRILEETRRRERLQRYHSPAVIDRILSEAGEGNVALQVQEREISVLFVDIVGFTTMSESMEPGAVARVLNRFFARMADVIFEAEGTLDKFIGDAILAVFGAPLEQPDHAMRAVRVAREMRSALEQLNREQPDRPLEVRTAINSGLATAGDIGSPKRREYTVLGDVVNTCARMQANVCLPGQIVLSQTTVDQLAGTVPTRRIGPFQLRGRQAAVDIYEVI
jgi:adenylate cyclase